jgi:hypothetical protein
MGYPARSIFFLTKISSNDIKSIDICTTTEIFSLPGLFFVDALVFLETKNVCYACWKLIGTDVSCQNYRVSPYIISVAGWSGWQGQEDWYETSNNLMLTRQTRMYNLGKVCPITEHQDDPCSSNVHHTWFENREPSSSFLCILVSSLPLMILSIITKTKIG